jgi:hypothetical protein
MPLDELVMYVTKGGKYQFVLPETDAHENIILSAVPTPQGIFQDVTLTSGVSRIPASWQKVEMRSLSSRDLKKVIERICPFIKVICKYQSLFC